jgi:hypothetical protein
MFLENNVPFQICNGPFQISNGPQIWLVKLRASLCIDKYHFLDLYGLCNMSTCCRLDLKQANLTTVWLLGLLVSDLTYTTCTKHLLNLDVLVWLFAFSCCTIHTILKNSCSSLNFICIDTGIGKNFLSKRLWPLTWPHQGAILENNVPFQICNGPFQISNGPQIWIWNKQT